MASGDLLGVEPLELEFPFQLNKQISCSMHLSNKTDDFVAFKVKTTSPKKYCVQPNVGIILPRSTCDVVVTMQAQLEAPPDMQCKDKFLVQSVATSSTTTLQDITQAMFSKESGKLVDEVKLHVVYVSPPQPPSTIAEESEEGTSPGPVVPDNMIARDFVTASNQQCEEYEEKPLEVTPLMSRLAEEKNSALQQNSKLRQEVELMRREVNKKRGFSLMFVMIVALLGVLLGYLMKK